MEDTTPHLRPIFALISLAFPLHTFPIQFHPFPPQPLINSSTHIMIPSFFLSSPTLFFTLSIHFPTHQTSTWLPSHLPFLTADTSPLHTPTLFWLALNVHHTSFTLLVTHHSSPLLSTPPSLPPFPYLCCSTPPLFILPHLPDSLPLFIHTHCSLTFPFPHLCPFSHPHSIHLSPLTFLPTYISPHLSFPHLSYSISFTPSTLRYLHSPHTPYRILPPPQHLLLLRLLHSTPFTLPALLAVPTSP